MKFDFNVFSFQGQALECLMEKTIKENKNPLLISRISMKVLNYRDLNYSQPRLWVNSNLMNCICSESKPVHNYRRKPSDKCFVN